MDQMEARGGEKDELNQFWDVNGQRNRMQCHSNVQFEANLLLDRLAEQLITFWGSKVTADLYFMNTFKGYFFLEFSQILHVIVILLGQIFLQTQTVFKDKVGLSPFWVEKDSIWGTSRYADSEKPSL